MTAASLGAVDLPALPEPWADTVHGWAYTADQMREYARAAVAALTPAAGAPVKLERWGFPNGQRPPARLDDGYWTPWHIAQAAVDAAAPPPADAVRALVGTWRADVTALLAANALANGVQAVLLNRCADELERAMSAAPDGFDRFMAGQPPEVRAAVDARAAELPAAVPTPEGAKQRKDCEAPCIFCNYSGEGYWQKFTHARYCPWYWVGGMNERRDIMQTITIPEANRHDR